MDYISSEERVRWKQIDRSFHSHWERALLERLVLSIIKKHVAIPCSRDVAVLLDDIIGFDTLKCLMSIHRQQFFAESIGNLEDASSKVVWLHFTAVLIDLLFVLAN